MDQMVGSADRIEQELGQRPAYFAFPCGDPGSAGPRDFALAARAGFKTAVTTRKGMLFSDHRDHLTALPRVSLNAIISRSPTRRFISPVLRLPCGTAFSRSTPPDQDQSGRCIQRMRRPAGITHNSPATRK
jgi:hypothetical protein